MPDTSYSLSYHYLIENYPGDSGAATAEGTLSFTLIPEPSSLTLLASGALVLMRRRR